MCSEILCNLITELNYILKDINSQLLESLPFLFLLSKHINHNSAGEKKKPQSLTVKPSALCFFCQTKRHKIGVPLKFSMISASLISFSASLICTKETLID